MTLDRELLEKCRRGDAEAIRTVYQRYADGLLSLAMNLLGERHGAEDVVQEVFIKFIESVPQIRDAGRLWSYLCQCVANRARDQFRLRSRRQMTEISSLEWLHDRRQGPLRLVESREELAQLGLALESLPHEQRETVVLHAQAGLKFRQIARLQQVSVATVLSRYRYGLQKLRARLDGRVQI